MMGSNGIGAVAPVARDISALDRPSAELASQPMTSSTGAAATNSALSVSESTELGTFGVIDIARLSVIG